MRENLMIDIHDDGDIEVCATSESNGWAVWSSHGNVVDGDSWKNGWVGWGIRPGEKFVPHLRVLLLTGPRFEEINLMLRRPV